MSTRTADVFEDYLSLVQAGDVETDIARNVAPDIVLLTSYGVFRGLDGVRKAAALLDRQVGRTEYIYRARLWHGELAFLEWSAEGERFRIEDGADSYWIPDGRIQAMTIHYTAERE
jgi:SnoaL-like domain